MKIAIVNRHPADFIGGSELQCINIAEELVNRGNEVIYIAVDGTKDRDYAVPYKVLPVEGSAESIITAVTAIQPDLVYWRVNKFHLYRSAKAIKAQGIPIIFAISHFNDTRRFHHYFHHKDLMTRIRAVKHIFTNALNYRGYRYVDAVTCLNRDYIGKVPVANQRLIFDCVDTRQEPFTWQRPFIIWVATIKTAKRPERFLELAQACVDLDVDFLMIGPVTDQKFNWLKNKNLSSNFHYLGPKSIQQVNGMIEQSLFLVHTCLPEGFGNNFIQAWFCAKPTLSLGYDPEGTITRERLGADSGDNFDDFVAQTRAHIGDAALRDAAGKRAGIYAEATFSTQRTVDELYTLMQEVTHPA
ncbi:MAG: glycosyltransferase, family [Sphingomonadales bacterium]|nr:glycosyltransferase, family [Sphingomonadales bacterium]